MDHLIDALPVELLDDICSHGCLPVIGAGFSLNALLPDGCQMPLWNDLGFDIAKRLKKSYNGDPKKVLSDYCSNPGKRHDLLRILRKRLHVGSARPGEAHKEFAKLPFKHVLTTNFDFLLERAYDDIGKTYLPIVDADLISFRADDEIRIVKMHGDLHHPSLMVVTEEDYDKFIEKQSEMFFEVSSLLKHNSLLFLGYSIDDPDFRQIWHLAKSRLKGLDRPSYTVVIDASDDEVTTYKQRGVSQVINLPGTRNSHGKILSKVFRQIGQEINKRGIK